MSFNTIGLYANYWDDDFTIPPRRSRNPIFMLRWAQWFKSNPRSLDYMQRLFVERFPDGKFYDVHEVDPAILKSLIAVADEIVLLYPDAIGLGFSGIEKQVRHEASSMVCIHVLNGRKRNFLLSKTVQANLRKRRFLELTMLPEIIVGLLIVALTPFVLIVDLLKGKR